MQRLVDQQARKAAAVHEEVRGDGLAFLGGHRGDRTLRVKPGVSHVTALVAHPALERLFVEELPEQHRIEVIAVPDIEGKAVARLGRAALCGQACGDEEAVRMRMHLDAVDPRLDIVDKLPHGQVVQHRGKGVEVALEAGLGRPPVEGDAALVGRVASGHPLGLLDAETVEEAP